MTYETDDFARFRFTPRTGQSAADRGYAGEHFRRQRNKHGAIADKVILVMAGACLGGTLVIHFIAKVCAP